jgi:hypothetical protein
MKYPVSHRSASLRSCPTHLNVLGLRIRLNLVSILIVTRTGGVVGIGAFLREL